MRISIALCTYNGAQFLPEQLESIACQTRLPDELVVCDDVSTDDTLAIVQAFAQRAPFPVIIEHNPHNLGSTRNFEKAIRLCGGDIIALADQDDYWLPEKLALLEQALGQHPEAGLVFSDAEVVDRNLQPLHRTMWQHVTLDAEKKRRIQTDQAFSMLLKRRYVTGAAMAFRAAYRDRVLPISPRWVHDSWISINIAAHARFALVDRPTILYRQHADNQIGATAKQKHILARILYLMRSQPETYTREYQAYLDLHNHLLLHLGPDSGAGIRQQIEAKVEHWRIRSAIEMSPAQRLRAILSEVQNQHYQKYAVHGGWSALRDVLYLGFSLVDRPVTRR